MRPAHHHGTHRRRRDGRRPTAARGGGRRVRPDEVGHDDQRRAGCTRTSPGGDRCRLKTATTARLGLTPLDRAPPRRRPPFGGRRAPRRRPPRASGPASPTDPKPRPGNGRPGSSPATGAPAAARGRGQARPIQVGRTSPPPATTSRPRQRVRGDRPRARPPRGRDPPAWRRSGREARWAGSTTRSKQRRHRRPAGVVPFAPESCTCRTKPPGRSTSRAVEVEVAQHAPEELGGPGVGQGLGELVAPSLVFRLQGAEFVDGVGPPLRPGPAVLRARPPGRARRRRRGRTPGLPRWLPRPRLSVASTSGQCDHLAPAHPQPGRGVRRSRR